MLVQAWLDKLQVRRRLIKGNWFSVGGGGEASKPFPGEAQGRRGILWGAWGEGGGETEA